MNTLLSRNPRTGETLKEIPKTAIEELPEIFLRAQRAQERWAKESISFRIKKIIQLREVLIRKSDSLAETIHLENGKPVTEALTCEVIPCLELLTVFADCAKRVLSQKKIKLRNPLLFHRRSTLDYWPLGTVAVISPWNFPLYLAFGDIALAILAGNAVVFKPSEHTPLVGARIQELFDEAGFPIDLLQTVQGEGPLGAAIVEQGPAKVFFTGSTRTGKAILASSAKRLTPVVLELGGKDAMLVLPDADLDLATSAALWGGYVNSGQVCASIERVLLPENLVAEFIDRLKTKIAAVPMEDWAFITMESQKQVYESHLEDARARKLTFNLGGDFTEDKRRLNPTIVSGPGIEQSLVYQDETFGPVLAVATYRNIPEAIEKVNHSRYGLVASVFGRDLSLAGSVARELQVGSVLINEVTYTAGVPETPWGGIKESGNGRKHSDQGLLEFVHVRHIHAPRMRWLCFKSLWWFPYGPHQKELFRAWVQQYRASLFERVKNLPHLLWSFVQLIKKEPRI
jgi:acyl-CoA reductase-like NAD-dependent aldehyde dehydrogenase